MWFRPETLRHTTFDIKKYFEASSHCNKSTYMQPFSELNRGMLLLDWKVESGATIYGKESSARAQLLARMPHKHSCMSWDNALRTFV